LKIYEIDVGPVSLTFCRPNSDRRAQKRRPFYVSRSDGDRSRHYKIASRDEGVFCLENERYDRVGFGQTRVKQQCARCIVFTRTVFRVIRTIRRRDFHVRIISASTYTWQRTSRRRPRRQQIVVGDTNSNDSP